MRIHKSYCTWDHGKTTYLNTSSIGNPVDGVQSSIMLWFFCRFKLLKDLGFWMFWGKPLQSECILRRCFCRGNSFIDAVVLTIGILGISCAVSFPVACFMSMARLAYLARSTTSTSHVPGWENLFPPIDLIHCGMKMAWSLYFCVSLKKTFGNCMISTKKQ